MFSRGATLRVLTLVVLAPHASTFVLQDVESESALVLLQHRADVIPAVYDPVEPAEPAQPAVPAEPAGYPIPDTTGISDGAASSSDEAASSASSHDLGDFAHDGHHSIFRVHLSDLDQKPFWRIFMGMIGATIVVDRGQALLDYLCQDSEPQKLFLQRVYSELMMFGVVAIGVFIFTNFYASMSEATHLKFEFVDILCSMGACGLIFIAGCFFLLYNVISKVWAAEEVDTEPTKLGVFGRTALNNRPALASCTSRLCPPSRAKEVEAEPVVLNTPRSIEYRKVKRAFLMKCHLPDDFHYDQYLDRELVKNAVELMTVHWTTWLAFLALPVLGFVDREKLETTNMPDIIFLAVLERVIWFTFGGHVLILIWLFWARRMLDATVDDDHAHQTKEEMSSKQPVTARSMALCAHVLQFFALVNAFLIAVYLMSVIYNVSFTPNSTFWLLAEGWGLAINTLVLLPLILIRMTFVGAYFVPDSQIVGAVLEDSSRVPGDLAQLRKAWREKGKKAATNDEDCDMDEEAFADFLHDMNLFVSASRQRRLFSHMDADGSGTVSRQELMSMLAKEGP